jgi:1,4-dihydroxy-2-naphthoate octaprenyltransferase
MTLKRTPARLLIFVLVILVCGLGAVSFSWWVDPLRFSWMLLLLSVSVILSETIAVRLPNGGTQSIS